MPADRRPALPIACTLGASEGLHRVKEWRRVATTYGLGRESGPGELVLRFRDTADSRAELVRLVAAERECCAFLGWELLHVDDECRVVVRGDDVELQSLSLGEG